MIKENFSDIGEQKIKNILKKSLGKGFSAFLFGSRARGDFRANSDYDIGIRGKNKLDFETFLEIKSELNDLPFLIDLVDFGRVSDDFKKIALKNIKKII